MVTLVPSQASRRGYLDQRPSKGLWFKANARQREEFLCAAVSPFHQHIVLRSAVTEKPPLLRRSSAGTVSSFELKKLFVDSETTVLG